MNNYDQNQSGLNQSKMDDVKANGENVANELLEQGKKFATHMYEEGRDRLSQAEGSLKEYSDELLNKVQENPMQAVLIAAGVGFLLSSLIRK